MTLTFRQRDISQEKALQGKLGNFQNMCQFHYPSYAILSAPLPYFALPRMGEATGPELQLLEAPFI